MSTSFHSLCVRSRAGVCVGANDLGEFLLENPPSMMDAMKDHSNEG